MSRKGENINNRGNGRWESRRIKSYNTSRHAQRGYNHRIAHSWSRDKLYSARAATRQNRSYETGSRARFGFYCDEWLALNRTRIRESTYVKYETALNKYIKPRLGGCSVMSMSTARVGQFGQDLLRIGLSPKTVRDHLTILHSILEYAQSCVPNMRPIRIVYPKEERKEMRVLSREEQSHLVSYLLAELDPCKFGVMLALLTGLRIGEVCALKWGNISIKDRMLTVSSTLFRLKNHGSDSTKKTKILMTDPKTSNSTRKIPLSEYAATLCRRFALNDPEAYILTGTADHFYEPRVLQYKLKKYTAECGIKNLNFHALRHTFATRCVEVGFDIKSLAEILGHTNPSFTLQRYVHSSMELKRTNMEKLTPLLR